MLDTYSELAHAPIDLLPVEGVREGKELVSGIIEQSSAHSKAKKGAADLFVVAQFLLELEHF